MSGKQAVVETTAGTFVIDLRPDLAPNHVGYFMKLAGEGAYANTLFHRVVRNGIIQGGDPLSKDPAKKAQYGSGGLGVLQAEHSAEPFTRGAVGAALRPGQPDSGGAQFFVCVTDQPALAGQFTVFGRVSEGLDVVQQISQLPADAKGAPQERVVISVGDDPRHAAAGTGAVRERHAGAARDGTPPCSRRRSARSRSGSTRSKAPEHVRNFLQLAQAGVYDGTPFHRVVRGFVVQAGALNERRRRSPRSSRSWCTTFSRNSTTRSTSKASCRWRAGTIPPALPPRSSSLQRTRPRSTGSTPSSAV